MTKKYIHIRTVISKGLTVTLSECLGCRVASIAASGYRSRHVRELKRLAQFVFVLRYFTVRSCENRLWLCAMKCVLPSLINRYVPQPP